MRVLLLNHHDAHADALGDARDLHATFASSPRDAGDVSEFEAVVLGTRGSLDRRIEHCRRLRAEGCVGAILALCADATEGAALLDAGADDFVTSPYSPVELITRIRVCVQRVAARSILRWGALELDRVGCTVRVHGRNIAVTTRECGLLVCLIESRGRAVSRATLRERVWPRKEDRGTNVVEVHMSRLRDKLGDDAGMIETVRGAGYRLRS